jgi:hypothetical protein
VTGCTVDGDSSSEGVSLQDLTPLLRISRFPEMCSETCSVQ